MKIFVAAMGPGEIGQGMAFARFALSRGSNVSFSVLRESNLPFLPKSHGNFSRMLTATPRILNARIIKERPDALVLCNSKIFSWDDYFLNNPPTPKPFTVSIDSNWLFFKNSPYQPLPWIDRYYINLPNRVFQLGLKQHGGHYNISRDFAQRLKIIGLIPSYKKIPRQRKRAVRQELGLRPNEKLVFFYASVGGLIKPDVLKQLINAVEALRAKNCFIKVAHIGEIAALKQKKPAVNWFSLLGPVTVDKFYEVLASSDLVFQHQGLGTLAQAISAGVPVIANVRNLNEEKNPYHAHAWEVEPFMRSGACSMFHYGDSSNRIADEMRDLLYNKEKRLKMIRQQKKLHSFGEKKLFIEILKNLKTNEKIAHRANRPS